MLIKPPFFKKKKTNLNKFKIILINFQEDEMQNTLKIEIIHLTENQIAKGPNKMLKRGLNCLLDKESYIN